MEGAIDMEFTYKVTQEDIKEYQLEFKTEYEATEVAMELHGWYVDGVYDVYREDERVFIICTERTAREVIKCLMATE